jgi:hypothetical protein
MPNESSIHALAKAYFVAKKFVIYKGFADEIDSSDENNFDKITEKQFLKEAAWVILSSGMSYSVISKKFDLISDVMMQWEVNMINSDSLECKNNALKIINHPGKINAIILISNELSKEGFDHIKKCILSDGIEFLKKFPFIGPATSYHLAKNIGFNVSKPDRHLIRISKATGFSSPAELCNALSNLISEKISTIDLVLWRYATLDKNYLNKIDNLTGNNKSLT